MELGPDRALDLVLSGLLLDPVLFESETMLGGGEVWRREALLCLGVEVRMSSFQLLDLGMVPNTPLAEFVLWRPISLLKLGF